MSKLGFLMLLPVLLLLAGLYLVSSTDLVLKERQISVHSISALVPDENDDCWVNFKRGMDKAAIEYNADLSFVTLYDRVRYDQQGELLLREVENGAQALIICPADSDVVAEALESNGISVPVVAVNSRIPGTRVKAFVGANRVQMGEMLAAAIREDSRGIGITGVVAASVSGAREDIEAAYQGLCSGLGGSGIDVRREYAVYGEDAARLLESFSPEKGEVIAALDATTSHTLAALMREIPQERRALYGIGTTNGVIRGLEERDVRAAAASNDYDAGYLSVKTAVEFLEHGKGGDYTVNSALIRPDSIYDKKNEMLLFPIIY